MTGSYQVKTSRSDTASSTRLNEYVHSLENCDLQTYGWKYRLLVGSLYQFSHLADYPGYVCKC